MTEDGGGSIGPEGNESGSSINLKYLSVSENSASTYLLGGTPRSASEAFWDCSELGSIERSLNLSDLINKPSLNSNQSFLSSTSTLCPDQTKFVTLHLASREESCVSFQVDDNTPKATPTPTPSTSKRAQGM